MATPDGTAGTGGSGRFGRAAKVVIACTITVYFFRQNILGMHESSEKALNIMKATTVMAAVMLVWCGVTLALRPARQVNRVPLEPDLAPKVEYAAAPSRDPVTGE